MFYCRRELFLSTWTDDEIKIFKTKLMVFWKNFAAIAFFLERKVVFVFVYSLFIESVFFCLKPAVYLYHGSKSK